MSPRRSHAKPPARCGSGVAVTKLIINGQTVELIALPLIFRHFREARLASAGLTADLDEETAREVFEPS